MGIFKFFVTLGLSTVTFLILLGIFNLSVNAISAKSTIENICGFFGIGFFIPACICLYAYTVPAIFMGNNE